MTETSPATTPELTLRAALRDLRGEAEQLGATDLARGFDVLDERLRSRRLLIAVVGEHNRGKSSLINSLIGAPWLPVGQSAPALPPVYVSGGAREHVELVYDDGSAVESTRDELLGLSPDDAASVTYARVALPSADLHGLVLVDTPGLNDPDTSRLAQTVHTLLPRSDLALLVLDSAQALGASEYDLVEQYILRAGLHRLVVVLNRHDDLESEEQRLLVQERVTRLLTPLLGAAPEILPYAARAALRGRERGNNGRLLARSGYPELRALLQECVAARVRILQEAAAGKALVLGRQLQERLEAPHALTPAPLTEDAAQVLAERSEPVCRALDDLCEQYVLELRAFAIALRDRLAEETAEAGTDDIRRFLPFYIQDQYTAFLQEHEKTVMERVNSALQELSLEEAPTPFTLKGRAMAPGLHPYVAPDFLEDSLLLTTFMTVVGLAMHPIVTGAMMTLGPALRMLGRDLKERDERGALLHAAQAATIEACAALEGHIEDAFTQAKEAVRIATRPPAPTIVIESPVEDEHRMAARAHVQALLQTLTTSGEP